MRRAAGNYSQTVQTKGITMSEGGRVWEHIQPRVDDDAAKQTDEGERVLDRVNALHSAIQSALVAWQAKDFAGAHALLDAIQQGDNGE